MNKKGFTLTELLVVIAIIGIIAVIAVPSVILVRKNVNKRLYTAKVDEIETSARLYASDNPDLFVGSSSVKVYVYELINGGYLNGDIDTSSSGPCTSKININGKEINNSSTCMINPTNKESMNEEYVLIKKENIGYSAEYGVDSTTAELGDADLVYTVCKKINDGVYTGKYGTSTDSDNKKCKCEIDSDNVVKGIYALNSDNSINKSKPVDACIISGKNNNDVNNYLLYNGTMWRVLGVYNIYEDQTKLVAKMITDTTISFD